MKKALLATSVLAAGALATPQFASAQSVSAGNADISFGGYARFGLLYSDPSGASSTTDLTHRFRLQIDATAESDGGVQFGARVRINRDAGFSNSADVSDAQDGSVTAANGGVGVNGVRFFARAGGLEVGVGNIFGALDAMPGQYPVDIGLTGHSYEYAAIGVGGFDSYSSGGDGRSNDNGVEVIYTAGDFRAHVSASDVNDRRALHVAYTFSGITAALGVQDSDVDTDTETTITVGGTFGPAFVNLAWAEAGNGDERVVLAGRFDVGAATNIEAYILDDSNGDGWGLDFNHNLGGGTSIRGGISETIEGTTLADLGVRFNF